MSGNNLDDGNRANGATLRNVRETPTDASISDSMLFKQYASGGQQLPKNQSLGAYPGAGTGAVVDHNSFPDSFADDITPQVTTSGLLTGVGGERR